jgi:hypothetical protein
MSFPILSDGAQDVGADTVYVAEDVMIPETKNLPARAFKGCGSIQIGLGSLPVAMLRTVHLDDEAMLRAGKIGDIADDRHLSSKAKTRQAMRPQFIP